MAERRIDRPGGRAMRDAFGRGGGISGRAFVIGAVLGLAALWCGLALAFRAWRVGYDRRTAFGRVVVASAVDPLVEMIPADPNPRARGARLATSAGAGAIAAAAAPWEVDPAAWRAAVRQTHAMLAAVAGSNLLDAEGLRDLAGTVSGRVSEARPETAREDLASLWDAAEAGAGPIVLTRHPRPRILRPAPSDRHNR
jgi:hypothetical protein